MDLKRARHLIKRLIKTPANVKKTCVYASGLTEFPVILTDDQLFEQNN